VANYAGQDLLEFSESDLGGGQDSGYFGKPTQSFVEPDGEQPSGLAVLPALKTPTPVSTANVTLTPSSYDFGTIPAGQTATETFTVTNLTSSAATADFGTVALLGIDRGEFSFSNTCPGMLQVDSSCSIQVSIPTADRPTYGQVGAVLDVPITNGPTLQSNLSVDIAPADQPIASVSPSTLYFGGVKYGTSEVRTVTLENLGAAPLTFSGKNDGVAISKWRSLHSGGEFSVQANGCHKATLDQGSSCSIAVEFAPSAKAVGLQSATLELTDSAGKQVVVLQGTAVTSLAHQGLQASPSSLDFGAVNAGIGSLSLQENKTELEQE